MLLFFLAVYSGSIGFIIYGIHYIYKKKHKSKLVINMKDIDYGKPKKGEKIE
jgi:hypothetical protein